MTEAKVVAFPARRQWSSLRELDAVVERYSDLERAEQLFHCGTTRPHRFRRRWLFFRVGPCLRCGADV